MDLNINTMVNVSGSKTVICYNFILLSVRKFTDRFKQTPVILSGRAVFQVPLVPDKITINDIMELIRFKSFLEKL